MAARSDRDPDGPGRRARAGARLSRDAAGAPQGRARLDLAFRERSDRRADGDAPLPRAARPNPAARSQSLDHLASSVSRGGEDADGIKLDFNYVTAPLWTDTTDRQWGAGEAYRARVLREAYQAVKAAKPGALVTASCNNPLFGLVEDLCRLNDDWTRRPVTYRRRAQAALELGQWLDSDDWDATEKDLEAQAVERPIWGCFTIESALSRGDQRNVPHPMGEAWKRRLRTLFNLAKRAPVLRGDRCVYDAVRRVARRTTENGALVAEAVRLSGHARNQVLVVREGWTLYVAAIASGRASIPLEGKKVASIHRVKHDGARKWVHGVVKNGRLELTLEDAGSEVSHYEVELKP